MSPMTLAELTRLLRECAGEDESVDLGGDVLDVPFSELGYDSLAVLQAIGLIERAYDIRLSDDTVSEAHTPRVMLEFVNRTLSQGQEHAA